MQPVATWVLKLYCSLVYSSAVVTDDFRKAGRCVFGASYYYCTANEISALAYKSADERVTEELA